MSVLLHRASGARRDLAMRLAAARAERGGVLRVALATSLRFVCTRLVLTTVAVDALAARSVQPHDDARLLAAGEVDDFLAFRPGSKRGTIENRLSAGHECICLWEAGSIVSAIWLRYDVIWLPEVRDTISLPPDAVYAYDSYTARSHRNRGLVTIRAPHTGRHVSRRGSVRILGYVRADNTAGLAATRAAGSSIFASLTWLHLGPVGVETVWSAAGRRTVLRVRGRTHELQTLGSTWTHDDLEPRGPAERRRLASRAIRES